MVSDKGALRVWTSRGPQARTRPVATLHTWRRQAAQSPLGLSGPQRLLSLLSTWDKKERLQARSLTCFPVSGEQPDRAGALTQQLGCVDSRPFQGCFLPVVLQWVALTSQPHPEGSAGWNPTFCQRWPTSCLGHLDSYHVPKPPNTFVQSAQMTTTGISYFKMTSRRGSAVLARLPSQLPGSQPPLVGGEFKKKKNHYYM